MPDCRLWFILSVLWLSQLVAGQAAAQRRLRIMAYNVENLFDTCHTVGHRDQAFTPAGEYRWDSRRYWGKLGRLGRVIVGAGGEAPVALVGLCEVEGDSVLRDLTQHTLLTRLGYAYISTRGHDERGLNVALLYQPELFYPVAVQSYVVPRLSEEDPPTRDILHVAGRVQAGDTLDIIVAHLPSRRGGARQTAARRLRGTQLLRRVCDSICAVRRVPLLIVMGDFNDEPGDKSLRGGLGATILPSSGVPTHASATTLYILSAKTRAQEGIRGTYKYKGRWNRLDQMMVSARLLQPGASLHTTEGDCAIYAPSWLLEPDPTHGGVKPRRTFTGPVYHGGVSDHLPLLLDVWW